MVATVTVPYIKGTSEAIRRILSKESIRTAFRTKTTIRSIWPMSNQECHCTTKGGDILHTLPRLRQGIHWRDWQNTTSTTERAQETLHQWTHTRFSSSCPRSPRTSRHWLGERLSSRLWWRFLQVESKGGTCDQTEGRFQPGQWSGG